MTETKTILLFGNYVSNWADLNIKFIDLKRLGGVNIKMKEIKSFFVSHSFDLLFKKSDSKLFMLTKTYNKISYIQL